MSQGTKLYKVADDAIEKLAYDSATSPSDRAMLLAKLRNRVSDHIVRIAEVVEAKRNGARKDGE